MEGAMGMPGFQLQPGQTDTLRFQIYVGPKLYAPPGETRARRSRDHELRDVLKLVSQVLLNFMNLIHGWVQDYGWRSSS